MGILGLGQQERIENKVHSPREEIKQQEKQVEKT